MNKDVITLILLESENIFDLKLVCRKWRDIISSKTFMNKWERTHVKVGRFGDVIIIDNKFIPYNGEGYLIETKGNTIKYINGNFSDGILEDFCIYYFWRCHGCTNILFYDGEGYTLWSAPRKYKDPYLGGDGKFTFISKDYLYLEELLYINDYFKKEMIEKCYIESKYAYYYVLTIIHQITDNNEEIIKDSLINKSERELIYTRI